MVDEMEIHLMVDALWWIGPTSFNANLRFFFLWVNPRLGVRGAVRDAGEVQNEPWLGCLFSVALEDDFLNHTYINVRELTNSVNA